jgi:hypothetical protein
MNPSRDCAAINVTRMMIFVGGQAGRAGSVAQARRREWREITGVALFADRGYDTNEIVENARQQGVNGLIPPRKNRLEQREYDKYLYKLRHRIENAFLHLKQWRGKRFLVPSRRSNPLHLPLVENLVTTLLASFRMDKLIMCQALMFLNSGRFQYRRSL